jgi:hypothetical protein
MKALGGVQLQFSHSCRMPSSGMWCRVDLVWTDVSVECIAFIFRVEKSASEKQAWAGVYSHGTDMNHRKRMSRDHYLLLCDVIVDMENTASSIVACWTVFTELLPGNALIKSITVSIHFVFVTLFRNVVWQNRNYNTLQVCQRCWLPTGRNTGVQFPADPGNLLACHGCVPVGTEAAERKWPLSCIER